MGLIVSILLKADQMVNYFMKNIFIFLLFVIKVNVLVHSLS